MLFEDNQEYIEMTRQRQGLQGEEGNMVLTPLESFQTGNRYNMSQRSQSEVRVTYHSSRNNAINSDLIEEFEEEKVHNLSGIEEEKSQQSEYEEDSESSDEFDKFEYNKDKNHLDTATKFKDYKDLDLKSSQITTSKDYKNSITKKKRV